MDAREENINKSRFWNFIDSIEGDKIVWIIVLMLIMISVLAIFSSTPLLNDGNKDRIDIIRDQIITAVLGQGEIWGM